MLYKLQSITLQLLWWRLLSEFKKHKLAKSHSIEVNETKFP